MFNFPVDPNEIEAPAAVMMDEFIIKLWWRKVKNTEAPWFLSVLVCCRPLRY